MQFLSNLIIAPRFFLVILAVVLFPGTCSAKKDIYGNKIPSYSGFGYSNSSQSSQAERMFARIREQENIQTQSLKVAKKLSAFHATKQLFDINIVQKTSFVVLEKAVADEIGRLSGLAPEVKEVDKEYFVHQLQALIARAKKVSDKFDAQKTWLENELDKEGKRMTDSLSELGNYNSASNIMLRTFLPDYMGGSVAGLGGKVLLMAGVPVATAFRKSLDDELNKQASGLMKRLFRQFRGLAVALGWASPLPVGKVDSWIKLVESYQKAMATLSKASNSSENLDKMFDARLGDRPAKQLPADSLVPTEGHELVSQPNQPVDDLTSFMKQADPVYVRVSEAFVKQLRSQISSVLVEMTTHYPEQQEVLNDLLKMIDSVGYMITGAHKVYRQPVLTSVVNADLMASCAWLISQLTMLKDMINVDAEDSKASTKVDDSYDRQGTLGRGRY